LKFLLENPFILVVLIGIISSFFKQKKESEGNDRQKRKQPKPFVPGNENEKSKPFFDFGELQRKIEQAQQETKRPERKKAAPRKKVEETLSTYREQQPTIEKKAERPQTGRLNQPRAVQKVQEEVTIDVSSQALRDAVVWAEILGPPRAKKAYNRRRAN